MRIEPVFVFDLDGTLVDSVYQHVFAWGEALEAEGISLSFWRIHRKVGMSGGLLANQLLRETGVEISAAVVERLKQRHATAYMARAGTIRGHVARVTDKSVRTCRDHMVVAVGLDAHARLEMPVHSLCPSRAQKAQQQ